MKKIIKKISAVISSVAIMASCGITALAATKDIEMDCSIIPEIEPWGNFAFSMEHYDTTKFTDDTEILVTYSYTKVVGDDGKEMEEGESPIEIIVQSWSNPDTPTVSATGGVWAKVAPYEFDETSAKFSIADMRAAYGIDDLSLVDSINVGATEHDNLTVNSFVITNCDEDIYIAETDAERAERYKNTAIIILAVSLGIIIALIVAFIIILKRKSSYAYNPTTGEYEKMTKK